MYEKNNIAIINSCCQGSTGKIASGLLEYLLRANNNVVLCYGRGDKYIDENHYRIDSILEVYFHVLMSRLFGAQGTYSRFATKRLLHLLKKRKVDLIYGIGLHGYYLNEKMLFEFIAERNIRFIYIMVDEYPFLGKCCYNDNCINYLHGCGNCPQIHHYPKSLFLDRSRLIYKIKENAYPRLKRSVFVGPQYTILAARKSPLLKQIKTEILDEAIDINFFYPRDVKTLRNNLGIREDKIVLVCIASMANVRKGCIYFLEAAKQLEEDDRFIFIHVGYSGNLANCPSNFIPIRYEKDQEKLARYYSLADLFVFPSLLDTMPNTCLEALACGSPLLCFNISGMPYIADESVANFVEPRNVSQMVNVIREISKKNEDIITRCREYAKQRYDNKKYYQRLLEIGRNI